MRTDVEIDDRLMANALKATGLQSEREVIQRALETLIRLESQTEILKLRGKLEWIGDLDEMRRD